VSVLHRPDGCRIVTVLTAVLCGGLAVPSTAVAGPLTLRTPASKAEIALHAPTEAVVAFSWEDEPNLGGYRFTVSKTAALKRPVVQRTVADLSVSVRGLGPGTYYWRVEKLDASGHIGRASSVQSFTITTLSAP
jgi:hypothetical protein